MMAKQITDLQMQANPGERDVWIIETGTRGKGSLHGRITPRGERMFYYRYTRADGKRDTLLIGPYTRKAKPGSFTVAGARAVALEWSALISKTGHDAILNRDIRAFLEEQARLADEARVDAVAARAAAVRAQRIAQAEEKRRAVTFREVFNQWRDTDLQPHIRADGKRTGRKDGGRFVFEQFERHVFPTLADVPFATIRRVDVLTILDTQKIAGKLRTANVLLADLKQLFRFAVDREIIAASNIDRIKKDKVGGADVERKRHLSVDEIRALSVQMLEAKLAKRTELAIWISLATGVRVGELMGATWIDHKEGADMLVEQGNRLDVKYGTVDTANRRWYIPDTKNQRDHTIHLNDFALQKFEALRQMRETDEWIFPASKGNQPVCVKSFGKQIADRQRIGKPLKNRSTATQKLVLPGGRWTHHDLRRTAASLMAGLGISSDVINECLNHKQADRMARVYIHNRREGEQRMAFDALGRKLFELTTSADGSTNLPLLSPRKHIAAF